jgi:hypothetical protein
MSKYDDVRLDTARLLARQREVYGKPSPLSGSARGLNLTDRFDSA